MIIGGQAVLMYRVPRLIGYITVRQVATSKKFENIEKVSKDLNLKVVSENYDLEKFRRENCSKDLKG